jgi:hypothetical protein
VSRVLKVALPVVAVAALGASQALATPTPRAHRSGLSRRAALRTARTATKRVVVVLKHQAHGSLATASSAKARRAAQARQRRPLLAKVSAAGGRVTRQYTTLNGFAATIPASAQRTLSGDPSVAAVIPDAFVPQPDAPSKPPPAAGSAGNPATPQSGICPTDPDKPLAEGEYLQTMHADQAQGLATGKGVKVAFFADGVDVDNPDFIRADGSHVFIDYRDFTGDGPDAPSSAAEAFGDASSIAAQGRQVYDLADYVNPAHPLPPGCTITVRGVSPGVSLIGMKVFGAEGSFSSTIVQGLDWAVTHDHADILSESFGGEQLPDTTVDIVKRFNDAAVAAGITVSQGSGDAGATASPSPPATDDNVIDAAASTNFRAYAQTASYALQFSNGKWLNDNISSIGGGGFGQDAQSVDVVAPGEADWALCSPNPAVYQGCTDFKGAPAMLEQFGGTSQATPLTAATAALIIEAYRSTHGGHTPSPHLVKQIIQSTANDLGLPAAEQGAGEVDAFKAVQAALSVDGGQRTGHGLLIDPSKITIAQEAGTRAERTVTVTNTGATTQTVSAAGRDIAGTLSDQLRDVTLGAASPTFVDQFGSTRPYARATFTVPQGADRLVAFDAWPGPNARVGMTLIDPQGNYAAYTRPQGNGNHGQVDVRRPVPGTWTAIVFIRDGTYAGPVHLEFVSQRYGGADDVSPGSVTLAPGASGHLRLRTQLPRRPGDVSHDLVVSDSSGDQTVVPVVLRSLVPVDRDGGSFSGTIIGGNGRSFSAQQNTFAFDVPKGRDAVSVALRFAHDPNTELIGTLIDPGGNAVAASTTRFSSANAPSDVFTNGLRAEALAPKAGRWKFVVTVTSPVGGEALFAPFDGDVSFDTPKIKATGLPQGGSVPAGQPITARIHVTNPGPSSEDVFADPRLDQQASLPLFAISPTTVPLPGTSSSAWIVPTRTSAVVGVAQGTAPILLEMSYALVADGDPSVLGQSTANIAGATYTASPQVGHGIWILAPALRGPFTGPAKGSAQTAMLVKTRAFDANAASTTGDFWRIWADPDFGDYSPLTLQPGESGDITVTFTPRGGHGTRVRGVVYVDDVSQRTGTGSEQIALPYSYRIR